MKSKEANELRLYAAEIIRRLWDAGETKQLELLQRQVKVSLEYINGVAADQE